MNLPPAIAMMYQNAVEEALEARKNYSRFPDPAYLARKDANVMYFIERYGYDKQTTRPGAHLSLVGSTQKEPHRALHAVPANRHAAAPA